MQLHANTLALGSFRTVSVLDRHDPPRWFRVTVSAAELTNMSCCSCLQIERVQNVTLWQSYQLLKKEMETKNNHSNNEKRLFHGTGANSIDLINKQGFNRSYAGTHGNQHTFRKHQECDIYLNHSYDPVLWS